MVAVDTIEDIERLLPRVVKLWRFIRVFLFDAVHGCGGGELFYEPAVVRAELVRIAVMYYSIVWGRSFIFCLWTHYGPVRENGYELLSQSFLGTVAGSGLRTGAIFARVDGLSDRRQ